MSGRLAMSDSLTDKLDSLQRCLERVREEFVPQSEFSVNETRQDAAVMNIVRACGTAAGIAKNAVQVFGLDVPSDAAKSFEILSDRNVLSSETCADMRQMAEFCDISLRESESLNAEMIASLINDRLADFEVFAREVESALLKTSDDRQIERGRTLGMVAGQLAVPDDLLAESDEINGMFFGDYG
jgi:uncharacterized protein YutE (UPF0331/DUF86 family)